MSSEEGLSKSGITGFLTGLLPLGSRASLHTLLQGRHDAHGLLMLLEQVSERFVGQLLKALASLAHNNLDKLPRLVIKLDTFPGHISL
jgi:hypothetical protein